MMDDTKKERVSIANELIKEMEDNFEQGSTNLWDLKALDGYLTKVYSYLGDVYTGRI